jgi:hypothetical protein
MQSHIWVHKDRKWPYLEGGVGGVYVKYTEDGEPVRGSFRPTSGHVKTELAALRAE